MAAGDLVTFPEDYDEVLEQVSCRLEKLETTGCRQSAKCSRKSSV
jgi:hypothetical protein